MLALSLPSSCPARLWFYCWEVSRATTDNLVQVAFLWKTLIAYQATLLRLPDSWSPFARASRPQASVGMFLPSGFQRLTFQLSQAHEATRWVPDPILSRGAEAGTTGDFGPVTF